MNDFMLHTPTRIIFGKGAEQRAGALIREYGYKKPLLYYGGGSIRRTGLYDTVTASLKEAGLEFAELSGVQPNPTVAFCEKTVDFLREHDCDFILAVGGGSVIDSAKMAAHCVRTGVKPWDYTTKKAAPTDSLPVGVILTISATGSETSDSAVLTNTALGLKRGLSSDANRPLFALMDPELTYSLPPYQTACGVVDIMMHTLERYMCVSGGSELIDRMAEGLLKSVVSAGRIAMAEPENYDARASLMLAGSYSHNGMLGVGREYKMVAHALEHEMSAVDDRIAHGAGLAVVWPAYARWLLQNGLAVSRLAQLAVRVWNADMDFAHPEDTARAGVQAAARFFTGLGMPDTLRALGLDETAIPVMAGRATAAGPVKSYRPITEKDAEDIYRLCL